MTGEGKGVSMLNSGGYGTITAVRAGVARGPELPQGIKLDQRFDANWPARLRPTLRMRQEGRPVPQTGLYTDGNDEGFRMLCLDQRRIRRQRTRIPLALRVQSMRGLLVDSSMGRSIPRYLLEPAVGEQSGSRLARSFEHDSSGRLPPFDDYRIEGDRPISAHASSGALPTSKGGRLGRSSVPRNTAYTLNARNAATWMRYHEIPIG